jgi:putative hemolysin
MDLKSKTYAHPVAVGLVVVLTFLFSFRRIIAQKNRLKSSRIAKAVALPMKIVSIVTAPFIWLLTFYRFLAECFTNKTS